MENRFHVEEALVYVMRSLRVLWDICKKVKNDPFLATINIEFEASILVNHWLMNQFEA